MTGEMTLFDEPTPASAPITDDMIRPDRFPPLLRDGVIFQTDRYGFPVECCGRCGGSGQYSYCPRYGSTCFGCKGTGVQHASRKPAEEYAAWVKAVRAAREVSGWQVQPGDQIRTHGSPRDTPFRTVATVEIGEPCGWIKIGNGPSEPSAWYAVITFEDGTTANTFGELWRRKSTVDRMPYVERAQLAMIAKLKRSQRAAR